MRPSAHSLRPSALAASAFTLAALLGACQPAADEAATEAAPAPPAGAATGFTLPEPGAERVYFVYPQDGATVDTTFRVVMGLRDYGIAPAGVERENTGHFHILVDAEVPPFGEVIPADSANRHFGAGQTETTLTLAPGEHTLRVVLGDHLHRVIGPEFVSPPIRITVKAP